ncbi:uncharacterized protein B0H18DRAFT_949643 [Fomitopsis serialis]|uniref:uncharacterized protein n=1 Tax=Fomitopsis serialis TaxID=139415 RepID=UPI00200858CD|nr:uncharacterized protein B0H18DRAFT_949643 [Neoantrodia serialis]KAH9938232.1 hypothetical protein B0H18DRAFT_949643 [Neoantrodia serialis]
MSTALFPPPRMPSPQYKPAPLPSPTGRPGIPCRTSRDRLHLPPHPEEPPIPPRLIGSPLLKRMTVRPDQPHLLSYKAQSELWIDGDEFGTRKTESAQTSPASSPSSPAPVSPRRPGHRRTPSIVVSSPRKRSHSPPPSPMPAAPPPPVPPIPSSALATPGAKRATLRSPPTGYSQVHIPDIDHSSPLAPTSQPKRTRWARKAPSVRGLH